MVPFTAGMMRSEYGLFRKSIYEKGKKKQEHTVGVGSLVVKRRGGVSNYVDTLDGLVKRSIIDDIIDNDQLEPITVIRKFLRQECALGQ